MTVKRWIGSVMGIVILAIAPLYGATYSSISELGTSATLIGHGHVLGFTDNASVVMENSAGLAAAEDTVSLFYTTLFNGDVRYVTGAFSHEVMPNVTIGLGAVHETVGDIDGRDDAGGETGSFSESTSEYVAGMAIGLYPSSSLGVSWTQVFRSMASLHGSGGDLSIGLRQDFPQYILMLGAKNILGRHVAYNNDAQERLPGVYSVGFLSKPWQRIMNLQVYGQLKKISSEDKLLANAAIRFLPFGTDDLGVSLGYKDGIGLAHETKGSIAIGLSAKMGQIGFDYAYEKTDVYQDDNQHYFSLSFAY